MACSFRVSFLLASVAVGLMVMLVSTSHVDAHAAAGRESRSPGFRERRSTETTEEPLSLPGNIPVSGEQMDAMRSAFRTATNFMQSFIDSKGENSRRRKHSEAKPEE